MSSILKVYNKAQHFNEYAVIQYVKINDVFITSQIVYPKYNKKQRLLHSDLISILNLIRERAKESCEYYEEKLNITHPIRFVIYIDKESFNADDIFINPYYTEYIEFRIYNDIVPGYTTCIKDLSLDTFDEQLDLAVKEIRYYVKNIGIKNYTDRIGDIKLSFAYTARRFLEKNKPFKDVLKDNAKDIFKRFPDYNFVWEVSKNVKQFNANKLVQHGRSLIWKKVYKYDINSSFWVIPMTEYTGINPQKIEIVDGLTKDGFTLDEIKDMYMKSGEMYFAKIKIDKLIFVKDNIPDWLYMFDIDLETNDMWVTNVEVEDILNTYDITLDDICLIEFYKLTKVPFLGTQRQFYKLLHQQKSIAKNNSDELLKNCLKVIGHCLHGFAIGNWFTDEYNFMAYDKIPLRLFGRYPKQADGFLTPIDSLYFYSYARQHLIKLLTLFKTKYYFDTDSIVAEPDDEALKAYNEWIDSKYKSMSLNPQDYTHDGHTIGYLELEEECDNFCYLSPKFYIWTHNNKLYSTTAGYQKNSIADKIEEVSGLTGNSALQWFLNQEYVELNLGYISDGERYIENIFHYQKITT